MRVGHPTAVVGLAVVPAALHAPEAETADHPALEQVRMLTHFDFAAGGRRAGGEPRLRRIEILLTHQRLMRQMLVTVQVDRSAHRCTFMSPWTGLSGSMSWYAAGCLPQTWWPV